MQVKKLEQYIEKYKTYLKKDRDFHELYRWESLSHFKEHWDIDAPDFGKMYDQALQNNTNRRLWKKESWFPKEMMLKLIEVDSEFVRRMFKDLFAEEKDIEGRISRFKFGCDEMVADFKKQNKTSIDTNHFHDDNEMIFMYLTFQFPEKYTLYDYESFRKMMINLETLNVPGPFEIDRFLKLTKAIYIFLNKDNELLEINANRLAKNGVGITNGKLLVHDFYTACCDMK